MKSSVVAILALAIGFAGSVFAEEAKKSEGQTKVEIKEVSGQKNKVSGDIDDEIQNAKLRAESGSKSKFSASVTANYRGGAVSSPFNSERPNLAGIPGVQTTSSIQGQINARYRPSKKNSFTLGSTYAIMTPFAGSTRKSNLIDPITQFNHVEKVGAFQTSSTLWYAYGTSNESKSIDQTHQAGWSVSAMHEFGTSGFTAGASMSNGWYKFTSAPGQNTDPSTRTSAYGHDRRVAYDFGIFPQAEYKINDRYSLRTVFGYFNWKHLYGDPNGYRLLQTYVYQSVGVGIAVARDVFIYPNVQFVPDNIRSDFTNFAVSTTINLF